MYVQCTNTMYRYIHKSCIENSNLKVQVYQSNVLYCQKQRYTQYTAHFRESYYFTGLLVMMH